MMIYGAVEDAVSVATIRTENKDLLKCSFAWKNRKWFWLQEGQKTPKMDEKDVYLRWTGSRGI
jgi:hypothetical protein